MADWVTAAAAAGVAAEDMPDASNISMGENKTTRPPNCVCLSTATPAAAAAAAAVRASCAQLGLQLQQR
jgi:hypothetical protein